jgi:hypothetical protein
MVLLCPASHASEAWIHHPLPVGFEAFPWYHDTSKRQLLETNGISTWSRNSSVLILAFSNSQRELPRAIRQVTASRETRS